MRLKREPGDFRVFEVLDESGDLLGPGPFRLYRVTKRGLTTREAVAVLAREAGVPRDKVAFAGLKDKDGLTGQFMTVEGGQPVNYRDGALTIRPVGPARRAIASRDNTGNSFEIVVRDLTGDDMRRIRVNLEQVRRCGLPAYFDDQRFGCLRHGQGFVVRRILQGDLEGALRALLTSPSRYGIAAIERYKQQLAQAWGDWDALSRIARGRRGAAAFAWLREHEGDFAGALVRGISSAERTMHLFAWQSHLWNRALSLWLRSLVPPDQLAWLPGDDGALLVYRELDPALVAELREATLPLFGAGMPEDPRARRLYEAVFRAEGVRPADFLALDLPGFRPKSEPRPVLLFPRYLRAAPAEPDEHYRRRRKMRLRFTLPRGQYATLVAKRLVMPTADQEDGDGPRLRLHVSRHVLVWPDAEGRQPAAPAVAPATRGERRKEPQHDKEQHRERPKGFPRHPRGQRGVRHRGPRGGPRGRR